MLLAELVRSAGLAVPPGDLDLDLDLDVEVTDISHDSRKVTNGTLFACIPGATEDGHDYASEAIESGASALVVDHKLSTSVPEVVVDDVRRVVGPLASALYGHPSRQVPVVGITGTNGKTTVTQLLGGILGTAGLEPLILGTLAGVRTTPEGPDLQREMAGAIAAGAAAVAMEVSSHALALHRVAGTAFEISVFTNLGQDHLDFHADFEDYFGAKATLFAPSFSKLGVVCRDNEWGRRLIDATKDTCPILTYGIEDATEIDLGAAGSTFSWRNETLSIHLPGRHNVVNAIAAATVAARLGVSMVDIAAGLLSVTSVRGRFEPVKVSGGATDVDVVVDYAHKPDALEAVLIAAREIATGRVVVVIGAGGDRDRSKRPVMGALAAHLADLAVITSDNPRSEDPQAIVDDMLAEIADMANVSVELDRATAIRDAIVSAEAGDFVVLAGKGHETTQTSAGIAIDFDDADHGALALLERAGCQ